MTNQTASDETYRWAHFVNHLATVHSNNATPFGYNQCGCVTEFQDEAYQRGQADGEKAAAQQVITFIEQCQSNHIDADIATWVREFCLTKLQPPTKEPLPPFDEWYAKTKAYGGTREEYDKLKDAEQ